MSPTTAELISVVPLLLAFIFSAYGGARLCRAVGLYLDGGKLGWICVGYFLAVFAVTFAVLSVAFLACGLLPFQIEGRLR